MIFPSRSRVAAACRVTLFAVAALALLPAAFAAKGRTARKEPTYKGAIVIDATTGRVLAEENADEVTPPASMTKLMTYAVLFDKLRAGQISLTTQVDIDRSDYGMGGTQVYLDPRERFSIEDLVFAMMIQSANDAAHALARVASGSVESFVEEMNAKARELGMTRTTFRSPHGLPPSSRRISDGDLTTPRDFAVLCRYLLLHTDVLKYTSVRERDFGVNRPKGPVHMVNHNKLLGQVAGVDGLKTGYTASAGYCLSATAERNGHRVIVVIMGAFGPGGQRDYGKSRDIKATELLTRGFAALPSGAGNFASERGKYVKPEVISLEATPAQTALGAIGNSPGPDGSRDEAGPMIKLSLPPR